MDTITVDGKLFKAVHISTQKSNLLAIYGSKGFLACRYTSLAVANKLGEAVAIVTGVKNYDDMLKKGYTFSDIHNFLKVNNFKMVFKSKMFFRKTFEYIYKNLSKN